MSIRTLKITSRVLTGLIGIVFLGSSFAKLIGNGSVIKAASQWGLTLENVRLIGMIELCSVILFIIPRTSLLGALLLTGYMGGAIATHLEHRLPVLVPLTIELLISIEAIIRFSLLRLGVTKT